jgi:hypothetical protein
MQNSAKIPSITLDDQLVIDTLLLNEQSNGSGIHLTDDQKLSLLETVWKALCYDGASVVSYIESLKGE